MPRSHNKTGRSTTERFLKLPHYLLHSVAWRQLSPVARAAFIEIAAIYNGYNNGFIVMPARDLAERLGRQKSTAANALKELEDAGFISIEFHGSDKNRKASEYSLTLYANDRTHEKPTKLFMQSGMIVAKKGVQHIGPNGPA